MLCAGIVPSRCAVYLRKSARARSARPIRARSYAEVSWRGPSRPDGVAACVSYACTLRAVAFIAATVLGTDPATRASALAASLPEAISIAWNSRSTV